jgi:AraC family transcriptional regulator
VSRPSEVQALLSSVWRGLPFDVTEHPEGCDASELTMAESMLWLVPEGVTPLHWRDRGAPRREVMVPEKIVFWRQGHRLTDITTKGPHSSFVMLLPEQRIVDWMHDDWRRVVHGLQSIGGHAIHRDAFVLHALRAVSNEISQGCPAGAAFAESVSIAMLTYLAGNWGGRDPARGREPPERAAVRKVKAFIEENLADDLSLSELAALARLSPRQLMRAFKTATGIPVHRYVLQRRIERAKSLLRHMPVTEVAMATGFASPSHFSTVFRSVVGVAPSQYQRLA